MTEIPVPALLRSQPRDRHGRVVGWALGWANGEPMQGTNDGHKVARSILEKLCGLCGRPLGYWVAFIGDEVAVTHRIFVEPPMHEPCAKYALAVCPYLGGKEGFEVKRQREGVVALMDRARPERMALYITRGFEPYVSPEPPIIPAAKAAAPKSVAWF